MEFNGLKLGDIVKPYSNDVNNVDYVTIYGKYKVIRRYLEYVEWIKQVVERIDIECCDSGDIYIQESPNDFGKVE